MLPKFSSRAFLAPMAGVSDPALRLQCKQMGAGLVVTEFTSIHSIIAKEKQLKETFDSRIRLLEQKSEKLAAENFEYSIENEELNKKLQSSVMNFKSLEKELSQLKVENQWLVGSQKKCSSIEGKIEESAREIQELRKELREEKTKVRICSQYTMIDSKSMLIC